MRKVVLAMVVALILIGGNCYAGSNGDGSCDNKTKLRIEKEDWSMCCNTFKLYKGGTIYCMDYHKEDKDNWRKRWSDINPPYEIVPVYDNIDITENIIEEVSNE